MSRHGQRLPGAAVRVASAVPVLGPSQTGHGGRRRPRGSDSSSGLSWHTEGPLRTTRTPFPVPRQAGCGWIPAVTDSLYQDSATCCLSCNRRNIAKPGHWRRSSSFRCLAIAASDSCERSFQIRVETRGVAKRRIEDCLHGLSHLVRKTEARSQVFGDWLALTRDQLASSAPYPRVSVSSVRCRTQSWPTANPACHDAPSVTGTNRASVDRLTPSDAPSRSPRRLPPR